MTRQVSQIATQVRMEYEARIKEYEERQEMDKCFINNLLRTIEVKDKLYDAACEILGKLSKKSKPEYDKNYWNTFIRNKCGVKVK